MINVSHLLVNAEKRYMERSAGKSMSRWVRETYLTHLVHFSLGQVRAHRGVAAQVLLGGRGRRSPTSSGMEAALSTSFAQEDKARLIVCPT